MLIRLLVSSDLTAEDVRDIELELVGAPVVGIRESVLAGVFAAFSCFKSCCQMAWGQPLRPRDLRSAAAA